MNVVIRNAPPSIGTLFRNPDLAHSLRLIQRYGRDVFYKGEIASAIVAKSNELGGTMTLEDLANYKGEWVTPASTTYHGGEFGVYGTYAPSQAWGIMEALNILEACVPTWYPGPESGDARTGEPAILACADRNQETGLRRHLCVQRRS